MKKCALLLFILISILSSVTSCNNPIYEISGNISTESKVLGNTPIINAAGEFEFTPSDDETPIEQGDAVKGRSVFNKDSGVLYFDNSSFGLLIYEEEKGELYHAHKDPLCDHKTHECPYFRFAGRVNIKDGYAYFNQLYDIFNKEGQVVKKVNRYVKVNVNTNEVDVLQELNGDINYNRLVSDLYTDTHYYYFDLVEPEKESDSISITLMRKNLKTDEIETVKELGAQAYFLITYIDGKIYWYDPVLQKFMYSENEDDLSDAVEFFSAPDVIAPTYSDGYIIYSVHEDMANRANDIWIYSMDSGEAKNLAHATDILYIITEKYIYYMNETQKVKIGVHPRTGEDVYMMDSSIWRVNRNTGAKEKMFRLGDIAPGNVIDNFYVSGNYIYAIYSTPNSDNNDVISSVYAPGGGHILRINITTKELYLIELTERLYNG